MKLSAYAHQTGLSYHTVWRMWKRGTLLARQLPSGTILTEGCLAVPVIPSAPKVAVYARVSSPENRANLTTQAARVVAFCQAQGWTVSKVVQECGSGVNDQRRQFLALLADSTITHIVVEHKDRCSRFGVAYIPTLLRAQGRQLVIINEALTEEADLIEDLVAIITSFTARLYGRRRARRKTPYPPEAP